MFDGKEIAIQILSDQEIEEQGTDIDEDCYLMMVKEWDPAEWTISNPKEIFIKKNSTLNDLCNVFSLHFPHIPKDSL